MKTILFSSLFMAWFSSVSLFAQVGYQTINSAQEVIERWSPDVHLYVKGDLGVGVAQYQALESWLDENAPHWTVVLMQSADGEFYRAPDGSRFRRMEAVEHALGHGLANQTEFGNLVNDQIGEQDGTVFVLFLKERKFSYYSSAAQDRRGLGESRWIGFLDRPAIRAMRGGGRILDAVKDTITSINKGLDRAIKSELADQQRIARAREQALTQANMDIELARQSVTQIQEKAEALREAHPEAEGALAHPPVSDWTAELAKFSEEVTQVNAVATSQDVEQLSARMEQFQLAYAEQGALEERLSPIEAAATELLTTQEGIAKSEAEEAFRLIGETKSARDTGQLSFSQLAERAKQKVVEGQAKVQAEIDRLERERRRRILIRRTILSTIAAIAALLGVLLVYLNRRRAKVRAEAIEALRKREAVVRTEMDRVLKLFDRSNEVLGPKERIADRGYEGTTKDKAEDALSGIDSLLIMSNEVQRVMDEARRFVFPQDVLGRLANFFSGGRYERGINHISGEPLKFNRRDGLPLVLEEERSGIAEGQTDVIHEATAEPQPRETVQSEDVITRTFEQVFGAFRDRCDFTAETLDVIEQSLLHITDKLNELQQQIDELTGIDKRLDSQTEQDGFFDVPDFFDVLIPSAQHDLDTADDIGAEDPVRAMQEFIPNGLRKVSEAKSLAATITRARTEVFPTFDEHAPTLKELDYETGWIQERACELGERANQLFGQAATESVAEQAHQFAEHVTGLGARVRTSAEIAELIQSESTPAIDTFDRKLGESRITIGDELDLSPADCLCELGANPDERLTDARQQLASAQAALHLGGVSSAQRAIEALREELTEGHRLVDDSLRILRDFNNTFRTRAHDQRVAADKLPRVRETLDVARNEYASTALLFRAGDPSYPDATSSTESHWRESQAALASAESLLQEAIPLFKQARLLQADGKLDAVNQHVARANLLMEEINEHGDRLEHQTRMNSDHLAELIGRVQAIDSAVQDHRTTRLTLEEFDRFGQALREAADHVGSDCRDRDPFENAEMLARHNERFQQLELMIDADRDAHAEAGRAVKGAEAELLKANRLVKQAHQDGIPDSPNTKQCFRDIARLEDETTGVARQLMTPHGNWQQVDAEAARINADLGVQTNRLQGELRLAQDSVNLFERASREVFDATNWTGRYGIRITGAPGADHLERAREALRRGDYSALVQLARAAQAQAEYAIQRAQRMVARRRREEERREEERRRRRRRSSISIGSGSGGISIGGGSSSAGGSSSNSGFSRSGW